MNVEDLYFSKKREYRFTKDHVSELLGLRVTAFQLEALGCEYVGKSVTSYSSGSVSYGVWKCPDLCSVLSELASGSVGRLGRRRP